MAFNEKKRSILMGVIRNAAFYRPNNPARAKADAEYNAVRPAFVKKQGYRCEFCGHATPKYIECHHLDGNHANNQEANFAAADTLCHAYNHIGQHGGNQRFAADAMRDKTICAAIPEVSAADMNLLQRVLGVALLDAEQEADAREILKRFAARKEPVKDVFESCFPEDFAAAMMAMKPETYDARESVIGHVRLIFSADVLKHEGTRFVEENAALPIKTWEAVARNAHHN